MFSPIPCCSPGQPDWRVDVEGLPVKGTVSNPPITDGRELLHFALTHGEAYTIGLSVMRAYGLTYISQLVERISEEG